VKAKVLPRPGSLSRVILPEALPDDDPGDAIVGRCPAMREVYKAIGRVADQNVIVLITGESGTGKELVAMPFISMGRARAPFWPSTAPPSRNLWRASRT
jgi:DNA-binding NtrC family response regulator